MLTNIGYLALLSMTYGKANLTREQLNSWDAIEQIQQAKELIPPVVARAWLRCQEKGVIPRWGEQQINQEMMSKSAL